MNKQIVVHRVHSHYFMVLFMIVVDVNLIVDNNDLFDWLIPGAFTFLGLSSLSLIIQGRVWDVVLYIGDEKGKLIHQRLLKEIAVKRAEELKSEEQIHEIQIRNFSAWRVILIIIAIIGTILISLNDWMWLFEN